MILATYTRRPNSRIEAPISPADGFQFMAEIQNDAYDRNKMYQYESITKPEGKPLPVGIRVRVFESDVNPVVYDLTPSDEEIARYNVPTWEDNAEALVLWALEYAITPDQLSQLGKLLGRRAIGTVDYWTLIQKPFDEAMAYVNGIQAAPGIVPDWNAAGQEPDIYRSLGGR